MAVIWNTRWDGCEMLVPFSCLLRHVNVALALSPETGTTSRDCSSPTVAPGTMGQRSNLRPHRLKVQSLAN